MSQNWMTLCVDTLTEKVSYVEIVKKGMALHYLEIMIVQSVLPRAMAGHCIYFLNFCQSLCSTWSLWHFKSVQRQGLWMSSYSLHNALHIPWIITIHCSLHTLLNHGSKSRKKILITFYSFWNLDFLHSVIPPFCLSENITTLHALAMQYLPAFYPLLLIIVTYILIELHDRNVRVLVWMWRPFHRCLAPFRGRLRWNPKASIVSTFATFLMLAYNKITIASWKLLGELKVTDIRGNSSYYLMLAPAVPYFGTEHIPFAILAIVVLSTFIALPPLLLIAYPTITFQKMLGCLKIRWHTLHIFADVFQGCYKNRTDGKYDYRYFAAFYSILRIIILLVNVHNNPHKTGWTLSTAVLIIGSLLFALLRPYKKNWLNVLDSVLLASLGLAALWVFYSIDTRKVDSVISVYCSTTTDVLCCVCSIQAPFMVGNTSEMSAKVKKYLPVPAS